MCIQRFKVNKLPMVIQGRGRYSKFTKVRISVPSKSPIHVEGDPSIDETIGAISPPVVEGTSWNWRDLTSHVQGIFDRKLKKTEL